MRRPWISRLFLGALTLLLLGSSIPASAGVSFDLFYSNLSPHGSWLVSASYGRVWRPAVYTPGWNPYYDGHWVCSDLGWTWVSDYTWGDIPYHYGTWALDPALGWVWVPGYVWAPAWVEFRTGPDFIGWAPVAPGFSVGVSLAPSDSGFVFVRAGDFLSPRARSVVIPANRVEFALERTAVVRNSLTVENHVVVNRGPRITDVERVVGRPVRPVPIERVARAAPFARVDRANLRPEPVHVRNSYRAAEPFSAVRPLPAREEHPRPAPQPSRGKPAERPGRGGSHAKEKQRSHDRGGART